MAALSGLDEMYLTETIPASSALELLFPAFRPATSFAKISAGEGDTDVLSNLCQYMVDRDLVSPMCQLAIVHHTDYSNHHASRLRQ